MVFEEVWDNLLKNHNKKLNSRARIRAACEKPSALVLARRRDKVQYRKEKMELANAPKTI